MLTSKPYVYKITNKYNMADTIAINFILDI